MKQFSISIAFLFVLLLNFLTPGTCLAQLDKADAVFEYDSLHIYSSGKKTDFIYVHFKRSCRIKIQSNKGANDFESITLPEWHDPSLYFHAPEQHNAGKHLGAVEVEDFRLSIIKADGSRVDTIVTPLYEPERFVGIKDSKYETASYYKYLIGDLQPGDIVEIKYNYSAAYGENLFSLLTFRIFFHGSYPVLEKHFTYSHLKGLEVDVTTYLGDEPVVEYGAETKYDWHFQNLPACMEESGIKPYLDLPHVIISMKPYEMIYTVPYSFEERFIPFYVYGPATRESRHLAIIRAFLEGVNSKDFNYIRRFIKARTEGLPYDSTSYTQLYAVHNYIAENCTYDFEEEVYLYDESRKERMGEYLAAGKIRDRSRYDIYLGLIAGLDLGYFTAYLADNRSGKISNEYFEPTISNDYLFVALLKGGEAHFMYPKKERFGYYLNELPFYFENSITRLLTLDDFRNYKTAIEEKFRSVTTPGSGYSDNVRNQSASVEVNIDKQTVKLASNISLSGQFSTLGRGSYLYGGCDPTVNPAYCERFGESFASTIKSDAYKVTGVDQDYPFKTGITIKFNADESISQKGDTVILDMNGWFNHITDANLNAKNRVLNYYPDFMFSDTYTYQIKFTEEVEVLSQMPLVKIENSYGGLMVNSKVQPDGSILIMSKFIVIADKIPVENINDVYMIQEKIKEMNQMKIKLRVK